MSILFRIFSKNYQTLLPIILVIVFFFSISLTIYNYLKNYFSIHDSYLIDQGLFLFIFFSIALIWIFFKRKIIFTYKNLVALVFLILLASGYFIFLLNFQSEILNRYFIKDDQFVLLPALLREEALDYRYSNKLDYYYYHFGAAVMLFKFFHLDSYYYNVSILATMALSGVVFLKLLNLINFSLQKSKWIKIITVLITLFYIVSPSIMDSFVYIEHSAATGYIVATFIASIYFYVIFLNNRSAKIYFILSFLLMLLLLKTAATRAGFLPVCLVLLEIAYFPKNSADRKSSLSRIVLLFAPFLIMFKSFLFPSSSGKLYGIGLGHFLNGDRIYLFFANIIPIIIPYQIMAWVVKTVKIITLGDFNAQTQNFFLNHILLMWGTLTFIIMTVATFLSYLKNKSNIIIPLFWTFSVTSLAFFIFFGNVVNENTFHPFNESLKIYASTFDQSIIIYGTVPGSRYYPLPLMFFLITLYLILISLLNNLRQKTKNFILVISSLILALVVWSNINFTQEVNRSANEGIVTVKLITEKILTMVPDNNEEKVIYSTSGRINDIEYIIRGFHGFFKYKAPEYFWQKEELVKYLKENKITEHNFFSFSFDRKTLLVEDKSDETRKQFKNYF